MADRETLAAYAEHARRYQRQFTAAAPGAALKRFAAALPPSSHVLDLGCGPGTSAAYLASLGHTVEAWDASPEMVALAVQQPGVRAECRDFSDLAKLPPLDAVWASFSLLHAPRSDFVLHLKNIAKAVRSGGLIHLGMKLGTGERRDRLGRLYTFYSEDELVAAVTSAFLNNTPVVVMFIPIIVAIAAQRNFPASRVLLPLSYISILGGMTTLIGSSTNLLVAGTAARYGVELDFFSFTAFGVVLFAVGALYVIYVVPAILGDAGTGEGGATRPSGRQFVAQIEVTAGNDLVGAKPRLGQFAALQGATVRSIRRDGRDITPPFDDVELEEGDILTVAATRTVLTKALAKGAASLPRMPPELMSPARSTDTLERVRESFTLAEAVVPPGSRFSGRTVEASRIRATFGTMVLGLQRRARMPRATMRETRLEAGDTLLVGGLPEDFDRLRETRDLLLIERSAVEVPMSKYAPRALLVFMLTIALASTGLLPIEVAALTGAFAMVALNCLSMRQAAASFDRQIFMLVGASLAMATALERTGGAALIANGTLALFEGAGTGVILSVLFLVTAVLTNILSNNATAVLFTPIALGIAEGLSVPPLVFVTCVLFAANCSFATPVGYQTNLLVMGPGRYAFSDFLRAGVPLVLLIWLAFSLLAPWWYGL